MLNSLSQKGRALRQSGANAVLEILNAPDVTVHSQSHESFLAGLGLYRRRSDKGYSLTDCISMNTMRRLKISEVLTADRHFCPGGLHSVTEAVPGPLVARSSDSRPPMWWSASITLAVVRSKGKEQQAGSRNKG